MLPAISLEPVRLATPISLFLRWPRRIALC